VQQTLTALEPYCLGTHRTTGRLLVRAFQVSVGSVSGQEHGLKLFEGFRPADRAMGHMLAEFTPFEGGL
jgi:hypothetical protein